LYYCALLSFPTRRSSDLFYFIMPQSVHDTYGPEFLKSLTSAVDDLFPQAKEFDPQLVPYQDRNAKTFLQRGDAILLAAKQQCRRDRKSTRLNSSHQIISY